MTLLSNLVAGAIGLVILATVAVVFLGRDRPRRPQSRDTSADRHAGDAGAEGDT